MSKQRYVVEITDTFAGDPNYAWVHRAFLAVPPTLSRLSLVRRAKALMQWNNRPCSTTDFGSYIELRPRDACLVMFITYDEEPVA